MIRICPSYERDDGSKVHEEERIVGVKLGEGVTHTWCDECLEEFRKDARKILETA